MQRLTIARRDATRRALASLLALAAGCSATQGRKPPPAPVEPVRGERQLSFGIGAREYDDEDFGRLDDPVAWTIDYCEPMGLGSLRLEGEFQYVYDEADGRSGGQDVRLKEETFALSAGVNYVLPLARFRPYAGAGVGLEFMELRGVDDGDLLFDDDDVIFGGYLKAGFHFQISPISHVGIEYRHFEGTDAELDRAELDTSYDQLVFLLGTNFE